MSKKSESKTVVGKVRVCRRKDGATFVYTKELAGRNDMRIGTRILYSDGTVGFQPDNLTPSAPEPEAVTPRPLPKLPGVDPEVADLNVPTADDL